MGQQLNYYRLLTGPVWSASRFGCSWELFDEMLRWGMLPSLVMHNTLPDACWCPRLRRCGIKWWLLKGQQSAHDWIFQFLYILSSWWFRDWSYDLYFILFKNEICIVSPYINQLGWVEQQVRAQHLRYGWTWGLPSVHTSWMECWIASASALPASSWPAALQQSDIGGNIYIVYGMDYRVPFSLSNWIPKRFQILMKNHLLQWCLACREGRACWSCLRGWWWAFAVVWNTQWPKSRGEGTMVFLI